jgi:hypothetical protein
VVQVNTTSVILYAVLIVAFLPLGRRRRGEVVQQSCLVTLRSGDQIGDAGRGVGGCDGGVNVFGDKALACLGEQETDRVDELSEARKLTDASTTISCSAVRRCPSPSLLESLLKVFHSRFRLFRPDVVTVVPA